MTLYWVTTEDHDEDWFVVATCAKEAARFHEEAEGYLPGDAIAEAIMEIPPGVDAEIGWPPDELLFALGARFLGDGQSRVVEIDGRKFCEGLMDEAVLSLNDDIFEAMGQGRINKTKKCPIH
jgi:hypothetical protein